MISCFSTLSALSSWLSPSASLQSYGCLPHTASGHECRRGTDGAAACFALGSVLCRLSGRSLSGSLLGICLCPSHRAHAHASAASPSAFPSACQDQDQGRGRGRGQGRARGEDTGGSVPNAVACSPSSCRGLCGPGFSLCPSLDPCPGHGHVLYPDLVFSLFWDSCRRIGLLRASWTWTWTCSCSARRRASGGGLCSLGLGGSRARPVTAADPSTSDAPGSSCCCCCRPGPPVRSADAYDGEVWAAGVPGRRAAMVILTARTATWSGSAEDSAGF